MPHNNFFDDYSFARVLIWGTLGGCVSDNLAYLAGRGFCETVREFRFYSDAQPRAERLTNKFGPLSIFLSKYIYGLRWASCVFYGVGRLPFVSFLVGALASFLLWVLFLAGAGYFFSGPVMGLIGDFQRLGKVLLVIVIVGIVTFYLTERCWLSKKVEQANPERLQEFEHAASEKFQDLRQEFQEHIPLKRQRRTDQKKQAMKGDAEGD